MLNNYINNVLQEKKQEEEQTVTFRKPNKKSIKYFLESADNASISTDMLIEKISSLLEGVDGLNISYQSHDVEVHGKHLKNIKEYLSEYVDEDFFVVGSKAIKGMTINFQDKEIVLFPEQIFRTDWFLKVMVNEVILTEYYFTLSYWGVPKGADYDLVIKSRQNKYTTTDRILEAFLKDILLSEPFSENYDSPY